MSIVGFAPPSTVIVEGGPISINTSHHCGFRVAAILDSPTTDDDIATHALVANYFGREPRDEHEFAELLNAGIAFFLRIPPGQIPAKTKRRKKQTRVFDWIQDEERLIADFQRFYGIDITNPHVHIHWWRFMALFEQLPSDASQTMQAMGIRARDLGDCESREERRVLRLRKKAVALTPRTAEEVVLDD